jgi:hypothetical protein
MKSLEMVCPHHTAAAKLMFIKLSMYLFFYMALGLNDFDVEKCWTIGRGGP